MADISAVAGAAKSIASSLVTEAKYLYGVEDQIRALQSDMECMQEFLRTVEANPYLLKQDGQLRILTNKMRELAFRAEDAIDTYLVEVRSKTFNKNFFLKVACLAFHAYPVYMLINKIEAIKKESEAAMSRSEKYKMSISSTFQSQGPKAGSSFSKPTAEYYLHHDEEFVVGIRDDISQLVKRLTDPKDDFQVLGVVGTGGAGKTTLASQIYHNSKIKSTFSCRVFVSISQQWSRVDLVHRIYKEVIGQFEISSSETELVRKLRAFMKDKQCLVVLDDIWKKEAWDDIGHIFPRTKGFRVILTTRIEEVPLYADNKCILHKPQVLTDDQMWELFSKVAVEGRHGIENNVEFENLGKLMLKKCHGLPLAVVTLAGILRTKQYLYEWERISVACTNNILKEKGGSTYGVVEEMLELSYLDLSTQLKPLFLYLAIIPEDQKFPAKQLTRMWIAEGFVTNDQQMGCETLEEEAMWLLGELAQRFIVQVETRDVRNQIECVRLHDLMREFCIKKAIECQLLDNVTSTCSYGRSTRKPRRISIFSSDYCLEENQYLRTMVYDCATSWNPEGTIRKLESIHSHFKLLRVLSISNSKNDMLPKEIGNLIHLIYLSIVDTEITKLPESVRNLRNLIYFVYDTSYNTEVELPNDLVAKMENLQVLELPCVLTRGWSKWNSRLGLSSERHKKLHTFKCGAGKWMTKELPTLDFPILEDLCFTEIKEMEEMEAIHQCIGFLKARLRTLKCWSYGVEEIKFDVEKLREFQSLWSLNIGCRLLINGCSIQFPSNLLSLTLVRSEIREGVDLTEVLERLPKLKHLSLGENAFLGTQLSFGGTSFPQLRELILEDIYNLEEWRLEGHAMDGLERIEIYCCPKLKRLPERIKSITTFKELQIRVMPEEFYRRLGYRKNENGELTSTNGVGEDSYIIQQIPSVKFMGVWD